ncbi:MAG TPA: 30S ribosomal protein S6 [Verrucomicrobiota bacterium]|nr:30S ribosomal protein S6 [Verrucomicrobiota bacterium]
MNRYEGLFILDLAGREEGLQEAVDKVQTLLTAAGAKVDTVQKMDKKSFARVTDKKVTGGHYVNFIFQASLTVIAALPPKFAHIPEVYRVQFNHAPKTPLNLTPPPVTP